MNNDTRFRRLVFVAALLSILTYAVADESWLLGGVAILLAMVGWRLTERRGGRAVPRALIALAIVLAIGSAVVSGFREGLSVAHFCQFTIAVLVIKCYDRRTSADLGQFVMLTLFLSIGALLTSNSLWMFLLLLPTLGYAVAAGAAYQFHLGRMAARRSISWTHRPQGPDPRPRTPSGGAPSRWRAALASLESAPRIRGVSRTLALGWAGATAISLAVFILFPRNIGADAFGRWGNASAGMVTGFTSQVNLGEGGLISTSSVPVLDLTVRTLDGQPLGAPEETFYLRGAVLDRYENGRWATDRPTNSQQPMLPGIRAPLTGGAGLHSQQGRGARVELDIMLRNARSADSYLFTVWKPRMVELESAATVAFNTRTLVMRRSGQAGRVRYQVQCEPVPTTLVFTEAARSDPGERITFPSSRITDLASSILRAAGLEPDPLVRPWEDDVAAAAAIQRHFDTDFAYTLDIARVPNGQDPIEWFLFEQRQGHCEYYASAMVAMCRSVGINARVVTGFVATEFNEATSHYVVRESNAHAWVEFEAAPDQWQHRDPTPTGEFRRIHRPAPTLASRLRSVFEAVNYAWITNIVAFDDSTRTGLVSAMQLDASALNDWADDVSNRIRLGGRSLVAHALRNALLASAAVLAVGVTIVYGGPALARWIARRVLPLLARLWRRVHVHPRARAMGVDASFYSRLLQALHRLGHPKPDWRPPLAHAATLTSPALADPASRLAAAFYRVRFGESPLTPAQQAEVNADLAALERGSGGAQE